MDEEKEETPRSPLQKQIGNVIAKGTARIDPTLVELRRLYTEIITDDERLLLKAWIDQVVPLARSPISNLMGRLKVDLRYPMGEDEVRVNGVPALAIKNAIEHWEQGEDYNPGSWDELIE